MGSDQGKEGVRNYSRPLIESKCHIRAVPGPHILPIDIDDSTRLADRPHMQHRLVIRLDGGGMAEDQYLGDKLPRCSGRGVGFGEDHHALAHVFAADAF